MGTLVQDPVIEDENKEIMEWLDKKEKNSVVFVSFGSEYFLSKEERLEVAKALELSQVNFVWVIRYVKPSKSYKILFVKPTLNGKFATVVLELTTRRHVDLQTSIIVARVRRKL